MPFIFGIITSRKTSCGFSALYYFQCLFPIFRGKKFHAVIFQFLQGLLDQHTDMRFIVND